MAQRGAVSALVDVITAADWIRRPWQEAARLVGDDWVERVTPVDEGRLVWWWRKERQMLADGQAATPVTAGYRRDYSQLALRIERAFDGTAPPSRTFLRDSRRWSQAFDETRDEPHRGRWQDVPRAELVANPLALAHLEADGLHYYAPRLMLEELSRRECSQREHLLICEPLALHLTDPTHAERRQRFTAEQLDVSAAFARA